MDKSERFARVADNRHYSGADNADPDFSSPAQNSADVKKATGKKTSPLGCLKNQSVVRAFAILKAFYYPDEWVATSELSRRTNIHEATVNRFVQSLVDVGALLRNDKGKYRCVLFVMPGAQNGMANSHYSS